MRLTAKIVPFSSIVGSSVTLHDSKGVVVAQLAIMVPNPRFDYREVANEVADKIVSAFPAPPAHGGENA